MKTLLLIVFSLLTALPIPVLAAPPQLIKDVNTPGRRPYEANIEFSSNGCSFNCFNFTKFNSVLLFDGPPVPKGKRLVIELGIGNASRKQ